ncbi:hypothetical protein AM500_04455 [Bacillus sp. FJAT-18017]|nr:hypothetical protein AM500_04455 [Bacillus sp. FJAT-18017]
MLYETVAMTILAVAVILTILFSYNKPKDNKLRIWGITTMFFIAPLLSWLVGRFYGISEGSGFAMMGVLVIMFPILFVVGFVLYWRGA